jgi:hypothetical protein
MPIKKEKSDSIRLETCLIPFFEAANDIGESIVSTEALNHPLELPHNTDGSIKFARDGRLRPEINQEISNNTRLAKKNFKNLCTNLDFNTFIESLKVEMEKAIANNTVSPELRNKIKFLFQSPCKKGYIQTVKGSFEMGKRR